MFDYIEIEKYFPEAGNLMIEPMKIHSSTQKQIHEIAQTNEYFAQEKIDGSYYQFVKTQNHSYLFGRTISKKNGLLTEKSANVPHIIKFLSCFPANTIIIGEIFYLNKSSKDTVSIMGCLPDKAIERQNKEYGPVQYYIYDILMYDGIDFIKAKVNNDTRYKILNRLCNSIYGIPYFYHDGSYSSSPIVLANRVVPEITDLEEYLNKILERGGEGVVFKKKTGLYQPGKRPQDNLKAKKIDFADVVIIGFEGPTEEYSGRDIQTWEYWVGEIGNILPVGLHYGEKDVIPVTKPWYMGWYNSRIKIGAYLNDSSCLYIGTIHSGISDEMKADMTKHPENYLGKVCSIQMMEKDNKECSIRHGFFKHMRPDKNAEECLIEEIFSCN